MYIVIPNKLCLCMYTIVKTIKYVYISFDCHAFQQLTLQSQLYYVYKKLYTVE